VRGGERRARHPFEKIAAERFARRERDGVQQAVEPAPFAFQRFEQRRDVVVARHVAAQDRRGAEFRGKLDHAILQVVVDVGERERGAFALARARHAMGDRAVRQHAGDQDLAVGQQSHRDSCVIGDDA